MRGCNWYRFCCQRILCDWRFMKKNVYRWATSIKLKNMYMHVPVHLSASNAERTWTPWTHGATPWTLIQSSGGPMIDHGVENQSGTVPWSDSPFAQHIYICTRTGLKKLNADIAYRDLCRRGLFSTVSVYIEVGIKTCISLQLYIHHFVALFSSNVWTQVFRSLRY